MSTNRFEAFSDGVFAIAIIWINHHVMIRRLRIVDHSVLIWNLALLMCVGSLPFTTALMAAYLKGSEGEALAVAV